MLIEAGKKYLVRDGRVFGPIRANPVNLPGHEVYVWTNGVLTWAADGTFDPILPQHNAPLDLVAEYVEPIPLRGDDAHFNAAMDALAEVRRAKNLWPNKAGSAHEQFAVTDEELDELMEAAGIERMQALIDSRNRLWGHVKVNQKRRNLPEMRKEAIQVAAMALRFAAECCDETQGRK